jgi:hypothetical protein
MTLIPKFRHDDHICEKHNCRGFCQECFADMIRAPLEARIKELEATAPVQVDNTSDLSEGEKRLPACGCTSGEDCNADCLIPVWVAKYLLAARDALILNDVNEANIMETNFNRNTGKSIKPIRPSWITRVIQKLKTFFKQ